MAKHKPDLISKAKKPTQPALATRKVVEPAFARHETFAPRYGWLKKGFESISIDPLLFNRDNAALELGVGKNMARAIRYWAIACGVLAEGAGPSKRTSKGLEATRFGRRLLGEGGWDPFLEDLGSLWLLHWRLLRVDGIATAWHFAFNEFSQAEFTVDDLANALESVARRRFPTSRVAVSSLRKDASCIVQMYVGTRIRHDAGEESIRSPFTQLELIGEGSTARQFAFRNGEKPGLTAELVAALSVDFLMSRGKARSIPFAMLLRGAGSPGLALRLTEGSLYGYLETAVQRFDSLRLSDTAGVIQLSVTSPPEQMRLKLLDAHYSGVPLVSVASA